MPITKRQNFSLASGQQSTVFAKLTLDIALHTYLVDRCRITRGFRSPLLCALAASKHAAGSVHHCNSQVRQLATSRGLMGISVEANEYLLHCLLCEIGRVEKSLCASDQRCVVLSVELFNITCSYPPCIHGHTVVKPNYRGVTARPPSSAMNRLLGYS